MTIAPEKNLIIPFRRDKKHDFASGTAELLLASKVREVLLADGDTPRSGGELPRRTAFGGAMTLLRHQNNDAALKELARVYVKDALRRWVPSAELVSLSVEQHDSTLTLSLRVRQGTVQTNVLLPIQTM